MDTKGKSSHSTATLEEHLRTLIQTSIDGVVCIDSKNIIVEFNKASEKIFGWPRHEVLGRLVTETIIPKRYREQHEIGLREYLKSGKASMLNKTVEISAMRSDGSEFPAELSISHLSSVEGSFFVAYIRDISFRRQFENELVTSNERLMASDELLRKLTTSLPGAIFQLVRENSGFLRFTYLSDGFEQLFDIKPIDAIKDIDSVWTKINADDLKKLTYWLKRSRKSTKLRHTTFRIASHNAGEKWIQLKAKPESNIDGSILWHGYLEDATERLNVENQLIVSQQNIQQLLENLPIAMLVHKNGRLMYANPSAMELFKATKSQLEEGIFIDNFVHPTSKHKLKQESIDASHKNAFNLSYNNTELRCIRLDGSRIDVETQARKINFMGMEAVQVTILDISERKRAQKNLQLAASVFTSTRDGIAIAGADQKIVEVNDAFTRITGFTGSDIVEKNLDYLQSKSASKAYNAKIKRNLLEFGFWEGELFGRHKSGEEYLASVSICLVKNSNNSIESIIVLFTDITLANKYKQQLEQIAHYDSLTGLPNRVLLADRLEQALSQCARLNNALAVVYIDLDGFKQINDKNGHTVGDKFLSKIASHMKNALRDTDTIARIGGDEFLAIITGLANAEDSKPILRRLLDAASASVVIGHAEYNASASVGVSLYPRDGTNADLLVRRADQAMYFAKENGKNQYCFFDIKSADEVESKRGQIAKIKEGIDKNQFTLHYQPKINMLTRQVIGAEALIRWNHPHRGLLHPIHFLPLIEDHPISIDLGEWVINSTIDQMIAWKEMGLSIQLSVNISAYQLQRSEFPVRLRELLALRPKYVPQQLQFEVLETSAIENLESVSASINACRELGVTFALDDFGTGYSSLSHLKYLPTATLKIDRGFIREMLNEGSDLAIVKGVIGLADALGLSIVAEGVETKEHAEKLIELNCSVAQGYYFAKPMEVNRLYSWMAIERAFPNLDLQTIPIQNSWVN